MFTMLRNAPTADALPVRSCACYPAAGGRATKVGRKPYCGRARPYGCPATLPIGTPGMPAAIAGGGIIGVPPSAEASGPASGAGAVQLGGTDIAPIVGAWPRPAETALPRPPMPLT